MPSRTPARLIQSVLRKRTLGGIASITLMFFVPILPLQAAESFVSDNSWLTFSANAQGVLPEGWQAINFDDSSWSAASAPNAGACGNETTELAPGLPPAFLIWDVQENFATYFRKRFTVTDKNLISAATLYSAADDDHEIHINGSLVQSEYSGAAGPVLVNDVLPLLIEGENVIAAYAQDTAAGCRGFVSALQINDPRPLLRFRRGVRTSNEATASSGAVVELTAPLDQPVRANLRLSGTATPEVDFQMPVTSIEIPAGRTQINLPITLIDDNIDELNETLIVDLVDVQNTPPGSPTRFTLTITDNDPLPVVGFERPDGRIREGQVGRVNLVLDRPSTRRIVVTLATSGTATAATDFSTIPTRIVFNPGETSKPVVLRSVVDAVSPEPAETLVLTLTTARPASLGSASQFSLTIRPISAAAGRTGGRAAACPPWGASRSPGLRDRRCLHAQGRR